jgi:hypothetical protein
VYSLLAIFYAPARYLNTAHACVICLLSLSLDAPSVACANNVMVASVIFGASLMPVPTLDRDPQRVPHPPAMGPAGQSPSVPAR